jgi:hypothetical protein
MSSAETSRDWIKVTCAIIVASIALIGTTFGIFATKSDITRLDKKIDLTAKVIQTEMKEGFKVINAKLDAMQHATKIGLENAHDDRKLIRNDMNRIRDNITSINDKLESLNQNHIKHLHQHK